MTLYNHRKAKFRAPQGNNQPHSNNPTMGQAVFIGVLALLAAPHISAAVKQITPTFGQLGQFGNNAQNARIAQLEAQIQQLEKLLAKAESLPSLPPETTITVPPSENHNTLPVPKPPEPIQNTPPSPPLVQNISSTPASAPQQPSPEIQKQLEQREAEISALKQQIVALRTELTELQQQLAARPTEVAPPEPITARNTIKQQTEQPHVFAATRSTAEFDDRVVLTASTQQPNQPFRLRLTEQLNAFPAGTILLGRVTEVDGNGLVKGEITAFVVNGREYTVPEGSITVRSPEGTLLAAQALIPNNPQVATTDLSSIGDSLQGSEYRPLQRNNFDRSYVQETSSALQQQTQSQPNSSTILWQLAQGTPVEVFANCSFSVEGLDVSQLNQSTTPLVNQPLVNQPALTGNAVPAGEPIQEENTNPISSP